MAVKKLKQPIDCNSLYNILSHKRQIYIIEQLRKKLHKHNLIVTQADNGKAVVIIHVNTCQQELDGDGYTTHTIHEHFLFTQIQHK